MTRLEKLLIPATIILFSMFLHGCAVELGNPLSSNEEDEKTKVNETKAGATYDGSLQIMLSDINYGQSTTNTSDSYQDRTDNSYQEKTDSKDILNSLLRRDSIM